MIRVLNADSLLILAEKVGEKRYNVFPNPFLESLFGQRQLCGPGKVKAEAVKWEVAASAATRTATRLSLSNRYGRYVVLLD